jgi:hypothetical protein
MKDLIPVGLDHLGVDEETRVAQLSDLLSKQLHALDRVAENDALVDLQLGEERVEAVDLLTLLDVGVVLGHALQGKLVHQVDRVGATEVALLLLLHSHNRERTIKIL